MTKLFQSLKLHTIYNVYIFSLVSTWNSDQGVSYELQEKFSASIIEINPIFFLRQLNHSGWISYISRPRLPDFQSLARKQEQIIKGVHQTQTQGKTMFTILDENGHVQEPLTVHFFLIHLWYGSLILSISRHYITLHIGFQITM